MSANWKAIATTLEAALRRIEADDHDLLREDGKGWVAHLSTPGLREWCHGCWATAALSESCKAPPEPGVSLAYLAGLLDGSIKPGPRE